MEAIRRMGLSGSSSTMAENDAVMICDQKIKKLKKKISTLYKELRLYTESYRRFLASQQNFFTALDSLYEDNWVEKSGFKRSLEVLTNIGQNGAKSLETIPIEETIVFKDQFEPIDKQIRDYEEKIKQCKNADKKVQTYQKKKTTDADELRRLQNVAYEKGTSVRIMQRKLQDELPKFCNSRMEFYSKLWRSVFQIHGDISKAESETMSQLMSIVRNFDRQRSEGIYDCSEFIVSDAFVDYDDYATEGDPMERGATSNAGACSVSVSGAGGGGSADSTMKSRHDSDGESDFGDEYSVVQKPQPTKPLVPAKVPPAKHPKPVLMVHQPSTEESPDRDEGADA